MSYTCTISTPLGAMTAAAEGDALVGLWFIGQKHYPTRTAHWKSDGACAVFEALRGYLQTYFAGGTDRFEMELKPPGSAFRRAVWDILLQIPRGQVKTYGQIAKETAKSLELTAMSARAVGGAVARNPISILIPCHRVIASNGALRGYAGGLDRKAELLRLEGANLNNLQLAAKPS
ncbi:MAG: methylated-DNA--[protein]-cysteine S-methyltransferase [Syntrophobacteraceae bacterium]|nr:methylated-DNA--[protein]-cysteine S-methyltransferase [Syntrophobacteraceae bacterium]